MSNTKRNIKLILDLPGNRKCADCASLVDQDTGWASLNLGVVMCIQCAGIHRAMGTHITKIRSFRLDTNAWTDKITNIFAKIGGNDRANRAVWEANLPSFWINPKEDKGSESIRKEFIRTKYEKQTFLPPDQLRGRVNNCVKKMPIEVRQIECDFWCRGDRKYKTKEFCVIHSRWLSRYTGCKKSKATQQIDLTNFNIIIEENTTGFEDYDGYEFSLYEDTKYIVENTKEIDMYSGPNEQKSIHNTPIASSTPNVFAYEEPLLRCRIKDFKKFENTVKDIRSTMAYYRLINTMYAPPPDEPPLNITSEDMKRGRAKMLGFAKVGWSKRYFCVLNLPGLNGFLYQYKEDISIITGVLPNVVFPKAICAWDLQTIDCVLDENGKRSGAKYAVLIVNGDKTISIKFNSGPEAVVFYSTLKQCWNNTRGRYYVDFSVNPPVISGDANPTKPILNKHGMHYIKERHKSSFYLPNPQNGALLPSEEQDALILNLIEEYVEKQNELKHKDSLDSTACDISFYSNDEEEFEDSNEFELSETEDALYRQTTGTYEQTTPYENANTHRLKNMLRLPHQQQNIVHSDDEHNGMHKEVSADDTDSCFTEHELTVHTEHTQNDEFSEALAIEQEMTKQNAYNYNENNQKHEQETDYNAYMHQEDIISDEEDMIAVVNATSFGHDPQSTVQIHIDPNELLIDTEAPISESTHNAKPTIDVADIPILKENSSYSPLSPPMSETTPSKEMDNIAMAPIKQKQKQKAKPNAYALSTGMNTGTSVAARISRFNQQNQVISMQKQLSITVNRPSSNKSPMAKRNGESKESPKAKRNGESKEASEANEANELNGNRLSPETHKFRRKKKKRRKQKKSKREKVSIKMPHLQLIRWFDIDKAQVAKFSNPAFTNELQQQLAKWGILSMVKNKRYIKVKISRRIPLPQRQQHWNSTIEAVQSKLGGRSVIDHETVIND